MTTKTKFWMWSLLTLVVASASGYLAVIPGSFALWNLLRNNEVSAQVGKPEVIINKEDADLIFTLNRLQWEAYAKRFIHPGGWEIRLSSHDTGSAVMAYDAKNGMGLSIQPLYKDDTSPPDILIVGSYYPVGTLGRFPDELRKHMEAAAKKDLGSEYSASLNYKKITPSMEAIEIMVS